VAGVDHQFGGSADRRLLAGGLDAGRVVVRALAAAQDDVAVVVAARSKRWPSGRLLVTARK
jgi:hypothetical protein